MPSSTSTTPRKPADASVELHPLLADRWSPRAFDAAHELAEADEVALLEAARWAPSSSNTQPWRFHVARRGTAEHAALLRTLAPGNAVWAQAASALVLVAAEVAGADGRARPYAGYDTGAAVALLTLQAGHLGLALHQMGGFDRDAAAVLLAADELQPQVVLAVGQQAAPEVLGDALRDRELAARERLPLDQLTVPLAVG